MKNWGGSVEVRISAGHLSLRLHDPPDQVCYLCSNEESLRLSSCDIGSIHILTRMSLSKDAIVKGTMNLTSDNLRNFSRPDRKSQQPKETNPTKKKEEKSSAPPKDTCKVPRPQNLKRQISENSLEMPPLENESKDASLHQESMKSQPSSHHESIFKTNGLRRRFERCLISCGSKEGILTLRFSDD
jgi:hypothetical protein